MTTEQGYATRSEKRSLSVDEKSSIIRDTVGDLALIMPAEPHTEVEELLEVGWSPKNIVVSECEEKLMEALHDEYEYDIRYAETIDANDDTVYLYVEEYMREYADAKSFSYVHLDYEGSLNRKVINELHDWRHILSDVARVRLTFSCTEKRGNSHGSVPLPTLQLNWVKGVVYFWIAKANTYDRKQRTWNKFKDWQFNKPDNTKFAILMLMMYLSFGYPACRIMTSNGDLKQMGDLASQLHAAGVPVLNGHRLFNINRYKYRDTTPMSSVWADVSRTRIDDPQAVLDYVYYIFSQLDPTPVEWNLKTEEVSHERTNRTATIAS